MILTNRDNDRTGNSRHRMRSYQRPIGAIRVGSGLSGFWTCGHKFLRQGRDGPKLPWPLRACFRAPLEIQGSTALAALADLTTQGTNVLLSECYWFCCMWQSS